MEWTTRFTLAKGRNDRESRMTNVKDVLLDLGYGLARPAVLWGGWCLPRRVAGMDDHGHTADRPTAWVTRGRAAGEGGGGLTQDRGRSGLKRVCEPEFETANREVGGM